METQSVFRRYSYRGYRRNLKYLFFFLVYLFSAILITISVYSLAYKVIKGNQINLGEGLELFPVIIMAGILICLMSVELNEHPLIEVGEEGIRIKVFNWIFMWRFIPWQDVLGLEHKGSENTWGMPTILVKIKNLTYWHKILGNKYEVKNDPIIPLAWGLIQRDELCDYINKNITINSTDNVN